MKIKKNQIESSDVNLTVTRPTKKKKTKKIWITLGIGVIVLIWIGAFSLILLNKFKIINDLGDNFVSNGECNVVGIKLHGTLLTYLQQFNQSEDGDSNQQSDFISSEDILNFLNEANLDDNIKAVILEVDSYGGSSVAGEEIADALQQVAKPTVALIRQSGLSAAYWAATGADFIFASKNSDVGSIGVTYSYLEKVKKNEKEGLNYIQLSAGKYKDAGDPDKALTAEEREIVLRDLALIHENFIQAVSNNRDLEREKIKKLADGSSMLGEKALSNNLIDQIGNIFTVKDYLKDEISAEPNICWVN